MKYQNQLPYNHFDSYCLRLPLFPFNFLQELTSTSEISDTAFLEKFQRPEIQEAIFLASPEFYAQIQKWSKGEIKDVAKRERIRHSFLKYLSRMATRCTPFGLFAHCSTGSFDISTEIEPKTYEAYQKVTRFDMHFMTLFANYLSQKENINKQLLFYTNSTLYQVGDRYRYIEYQYEQKKRVHSLESVLHSPYLEKLVERSRKGARLHELSHVLVQMDIDKETADHFIGELITNQILKSELEPTLTGEDFLLQLEQKLERLEHVQTELTLVQEMKSHLHLLDQKIGNPISQFRKVHELLAPLEIDFEKKYLLQTDTFSTVKSNTLNKSILDTIKKGILFLNKISKSHKNSNLERFKSAFIQRYEHERVPLLQVLDVETGIGYVQDPNSIDATPFLDDIVPPQGNKSDSQQYSWSQIDTILHQKLQENTKSERFTINLRHTELDRRKLDWQNAPDTMAGLIEVINENGEELIFLNHMGGSSAANLIARFSHGEEKLLRFAHNITTKEASLQSDKILAEIIHLPESRTGNVLRRPYLRTYEIPCLGKSDLPLDQQIPLSDLEVTIERNTIILYSKRLKKEVLPKLTNAHNYSYNALPVYHFLCDLQHQNKNSYGFGFSSFFDQYTYLPRIVYDNIILSKARWNIKKETTSHIVDAFKKGNFTLKLIKDWQEKEKIPQWVQLVDGDNTLTINLENTSSVHMLFETIKNRNRFLLEEFLFAKDALVKNEIGNYANQALIAFHKEPSSQEITH